MMAYGEQAETDDPADSRGGRGNPHRGSSTNSPLHILFQSTCLIRFKTRETIIRKDITAL